MVDDAGMLWRIQQLEERAKEDRDRLSKEVEDLKDEHRQLRSDYDKMISRSAGVFVAVLSIGALVGWVITQVKDLILRGHS